jgi:uncharacterized protein
MAKILITGGSGLVGTRLTEMLLAKGYDVAHLGRSKKNGTIETLVWDIETGSIEERAFQGVDTVIHLAGANVGEKRWTKNRKKEILESRTRTTRLLFNFLSSRNHTVKNFISASAIGYYGFDQDSRTFTESDSPGTGFLAEVVMKWEEEVDRISTLNIRVVKIRVGIVLSMDAGALKEMVKPVKFYVGAPLGSGNQKLSWIHIDDVCGVFIKAAEDASMTGAVNAVGPSPVTNRELTIAIARALGKPVLLPAVPAFALKLVLGEMADLVVKGNSVSNEKLMRSGYRYHFPNLDAALRDLLSRS